MNRVALLLCGFTLLLCGFVAFGCDATTTYETEDRPQCEPSELLAQRIIDCIAAGNPKSDEEPEDWLRICGTLMRDALCPTAMWVRQINEHGFPRGRDWGEWVRCDAAPIQLQAACRQAGWRP